MTMTIHELKTELSPFSAIRRGLKRAEFRRDDRDFQVGDLLLLREYGSAALGYTGRALWAEVLDVRRGPSLAIPEGYALLSIDNPMCGRCRHLLQDGRCPDCSYRGLPEHTECRR